MPRRKGYTRVTQENPLQLQSDILKYLDEYAEVTTERLIMMALVRVLQAMPTKKIDAEIVALIQLLAERAQKEPLVYRGE